MTRRWTSWTRRYGGDLPTIKIAFGSDGRSVLTNALCLSLAATSHTVAKESLVALFDYRPDKSEAANIEKVRELERERQCSWGRAPVDSSPYLRWNAGMATEDATQAAPLEVTRADIGSLHLEGLDVPYVNLDGEARLRSRLRVGETEYVWDRSMPVRGHSAALPEIVAELRSESRILLIAERNDRYLIYLAEQ